MQPMQVERRTLIFNQYIYLSWKRHKIWPLWNANRNSYGICQMMLFRMTFV